MSQIDGVWNMIIQEPQGEVKGTLTLKASADRFTGTFAGNGQSAEIADGKIDGDTLTWSMKITQPLPLTVNGSVKVEANSMSGAVSVASLGSFPMTGTRA